MSSRPPRERQKAKAEISTRSCCAERPFRLPSLLSGSDRKRPGGLAHIAFDEFAAAEGAPEGEGRNFHEELLRRATVQAAVPSIWFGKDRIRKAPQKP